MVSTIYRVYNIHSYVVEKAQKIYNFFYAPFALGQLYNSNGYHVTVALKKLYNLKKMYNGDNECTSGQDFFLYKAFQI